MHTDTRNPTALLWTLVASVALVGSLPGCDGPPGAGGRTWVCEETSDCPPEYVCHERVCLSPSATPDARADVTSEVSAPPVDVPDAGDEDLGGPIPDVAPDLSPDVPPDVAADIPPDAPDVDTPPDECDADGQMSCDDLLLRVCEEKPDGHLAWGDPESCDDAEACTTDSCDTTLGCVHEDHTLSCAASYCDGDTFFSEVFCATGTCPAQEAESCLDGSPCTQDGCDAAAGCVNEPTNEAGACDLGDGITGACRLGRCVPLCTVDGDCDDDIACTVDRCDSDAGACVNEPDPTLCDDENRCTTDRCVQDEGCDNAHNTEVCAPATCEDGTFYEEQVCIEGSCPVATPEPCGDDNPCTTERCDAGIGCVVENNTERCGEPLCDGLLFYPVAYCADGVCPTQAATFCDDDVLCTEDSCASSGCEHANINDNEPCTATGGADGFCWEGVCTAECNADAACADTHECTVDTCDTDAGFCLHAPDHAVCDDDELCTADICDPSGGCGHTNEDGLVCAAARCDGNTFYPASSCRDSSCPAAEGRDCDDGNPCTDDTCDPAAGCLNTNNAAPCGTPRCEGGLFYPVSQCASGACPEPAPETCDDGDVCTDDRCDAATGCFTQNNTAECAAARCQGGVFYAAAACAAGTCPAQATDDCGDANDCTDDSCDPASGCVFTNNVALCEPSRCEGELFYPAAFCAGGLCPAQASESCSDGILCTDDTCHPQDGCVYVNNNAPCRSASCDGDLYSPAARCVGGGCPNPTPELCYDERVCTADSCVPEQGCVYAATNIGGSCTTGGGDPGVCSDAGTCAPECTTDGDCSDGVDCTNDSCNEATGRCENTPVNTNCDDENVCTNDTCSGATGCVFTPNTERCREAECVEGLHFAVTYCVDGGCPPALETSCDDGNGCTDDTCVPATGCRSTNHTRECAAARCQDGDFFEAARCASGSCPGQTRRDCDDANVCTTDTCDAGTGCVSTNNSQPCAPSFCNGDVFYPQAVCSGGTCPGATPEPCADDNPCTNLSCDGSAGCVESFNTAECAGARCEGGVHYAAAFCFDGACPVQDVEDCDDGNVCTDDGCSPTSGCYRTHNNARCAEDACDGLTYLPETRCADGGCPDPSPSSCAVEDDCLTAGCDASQGGCTTAYNDASCDDGDACTVVDGCDGGTCVGTGAPNCDDGNDCTVDSCNAGTGCVTTDVIDGEDCTGADGDGTCENGTCVVCTPSACSELGFECGFWNDGCTDVVDCGGCDPGFACDTGGQCVQVTCDGTACPGVDGYEVSCNTQGLCEYQWPNADEAQYRTLMVYLPTGTFTMGSPVGQGGTSSEEPDHQVYFANGFFVDLFEVTAGGFAAFLTDRASNVCEAPDIECVDSDDADRNVHWDASGSSAVVLSQCEASPGAPPTTTCDKHPVGEVTWYGAREYCAWVGRRLCSESEWEYAAAGSDYVTYPWGDLDPTTGVYAACHNDVCGDGYITTAPVGSFSSSGSWCGCQDLAGNVKEWVEDDPHVDYTGAPTNGDAWIRTPRDVQRVQRGGDYNDQATSLRTRNRGATPTGLSYDTLGFRCCTSL